MRTSQVTVTGVAASPALPIDYHTDASQDGIFVKPGAGATVTVQATSDNVLDPAVTPVWVDLGAPFAGATANVAGVLPFACVALRLNQTVGATLSTLLFVPRGGL